MVTEYVEQVGANHYQTQVQRYEASLTHNQASRPLLSTNVSANQWNNCTSRLGASPTHNQAADLPIGCEDSKKVYKMTVNSRTTRQTLELKSYASAENDYPTHNQAWLITIFKAYH